MLSGAACCCRCIPANLPRHRGSASASKSSAGGDAQPLQPPEEQLGKALETTPQPKQCIPQLSGVKTLSPHPLPRPNELLGCGKTPIGASPVPAGSGAGLRQSFSQGVIRAERGGGDTGALWLAGNQTRPLRP